MASEAAPGPARRRPRGDILGPVLRWELMTIPRRRRYYFIRVLYVLTLLFALWVVYVTTVAIFGAGAPTIASMSRFSEGFYHAFIFVQLGAVLVLTPAFVASGISVEKERRTLEFLFATDLTNREIVFGKLFARTFNLFAVLLAGVPILAFAGLFGGVDYAGLLLATVGSAAVMMFLASLSLVISVHSRTTRQALTNSYGLVLFLVFSPYLVMLVAYALHEILSAANPALGQQFDRFVMSPRFWTLGAYAMLLHPFGIALLASVPEFVVASSTGRTDLAVLLMIGGNLLLAAALTMVAIARLRRAFRLEQAVVEKRGRFRGASRRNRWFRPPVWQNWPLAWKEIHAGSYRSMGCLTRVLLILGGATYYVLFLASLYWYPDDAERRTYSILAGNMLFGGAAFVLVAFRAATTIGQERDRDCWVSLLSTPASAGEIVLSKWIGAMSPLFWTALYLLPVWLVGCWEGSLDGANIVKVLAVLLILSAFLSAVGVYQSLRRPTTVQAIGVTLAMGLLCFGVGQGILESVFWRDRMFSQWLGTTIPWYALFLASLPHDSPEWAREFHFERMGQTILAQIGFAAIAVALVIGAILLFPRATGRGESRGPRGKLSSPAATT